MHALLGVLDLQHDVQEQVAALAAENPQQLYIAIAGQASAPCICALTHADAC